MPKKKIIIELEIDDEEWRNNEDLEDCIETAILDNLDSIISIDVNVKNFKSLPKNNK